MTSAQARYFASAATGDAMFELERRIVAHALPKYRLHSLEIMQGGATNSNVLIQLEECHELFVLRTHLRGAELCKKEVHLFQALQDLVPAPELVKSDTAGDEVGSPYLIYRFLPGITFREIRAGGSPRDMADAAHSIGRILGALRNHDISLFSDCELDRRFNFTEPDVDGVLLRRYIDEADLLLLRGLFMDWSQVLNALAHEESLVHGDFNHRNIVLSRDSGHWRVTGVLDWELAGIGSSLWDAARFICYEKPDSPHWETHFMDGFDAESPGCIPDDWENLARVMNTISAAASLANGSVREQFVQELKRLVHCGLRGKRIG
jgi:aminoglycoside phosphotransferase (APT) family kinase protein